MPIDVVAVRLIHQIGSAPLEAIDRFIWRQGWYIVTIINVTETSPAFRSATFDDANNIYQRWTRSGVTIPRMPFRLTRWMARTKHSIVARKRPIADI